jgi:hypothetical protein
MAYGPVKTDMRAMSWRQLFTAITAELERNKETFVRSASPELKKKIVYVCSDNAQIYKAIKL